MTAPARLPSRASRSDVLRRIGLIAARVMALLPAAVAPGAESITIGGLSYVNHGLVGVGCIPDETRDKFGETFGSSSGLATDLGSRQRTPNGYRGVFEIPPVPGGQFAEGIVPATLTPFIDINNRSQLARFGLHNGANDRDNLSEKWEGMALVPALDPANPRDYYLFVSNDNDFITQHGYQVGAAYKDKSGVEVDTLILAHRLTLPGFGDRR